MSFLFIKKTLRPSNLKTRTATNSKISVYLICVEVIIYFSLYNVILHNCKNNTWKKTKCIQSFPVTSVKFLISNWERVDSFPSCFFLLLKLRKSYFQFLLFFPRPQKRGAWGRSPLDPPLKLPVVESQKCVWFSSRNVKLIHTSV